MFSIISVIPLGCNNDDPVEPQIKEAPVDPPQLTEDLLLWKIYSNGNLYKELNYDDANRIESIKEYENGQLVGSEVWEYNQKGQVEKKWLLDGNGSFQVAYTYEFDNSGKLLKSLVYKELLEHPHTELVFNTTTKERYLQNTISFPASPITSKAT